jgi:acyl dehydratase
LSTEGFTVALDAKRLIALDVPSRSVSYTDREVMLYALAVGAGTEGGASDLDLVYEDKLKAVPSFANSLAFDDSWLPSGGVELSNVVHGSLDLTFHAPLASAGTARIGARLAGVIDKGEGRGGIIVQETSIEQDDRKVCTSVSSLFVRGGGGFGGSTGMQPQPVKLPDRSPDITIVVPTVRSQASLFRLLGDRNPLHIDPAAARRSGFDRPILHGACTYGIACLTVIRGFCGGEPARLKRLAARFAGPLFPGQALQFSLWREDHGLFFRASAADSGAPVLDGGVAEISA